MNCTDPSPAPADPLVEPGASHDTGPSRSGSGQPAGAPQALVGPWEDTAWLHPPPHWSVDEGGVLHARTGPRTDFWQRTFYGFERDDGHALLRPRAGEFTAVLTVTGDYRHLYDQAGLMIRTNATAWIKFGIELTDGVPHLSCVVTEGSSDWSAMPVTLDGPVSLRATRLGDAVLLQHDLGGGAWAMARLAPVPGSADTVGVGPYLCSPEREGFEARFTHFELTEPQVRELHA